jgi:hypothetical protein
VEYLGYGLQRLDEGHGRLTLYFRALGETDGDYTLWLHQTGEAAPDRTAALDHVVATSHWKAGEVHEDARSVALEPGRVRFLFGLWRGDDASRLRVKDRPEQHEIDLGWVEPED